MIRMLGWAVVCLLGAGFVSAGDEGNEASQFRGPDGNGVMAPSTPSEWGAEQGIAWSAEIPGGGWSSPVVSGDLVFVTSAVAPGDLRPKGFGEGVSSMRSFYQSKPPTEPFSFCVICVRGSDGKKLWQQEVISKKPAYKVHPSNSYATESPVADSKHVYAYFAAVGAVACLDHAGNMIWSKEIGAFPTGNDFGTGSSLAIDGDNVFVQCDNEEQSFVCALDSGSGEERWRVNREGGTSWSSPVVWQNKDRKELVTCGSGTVTSYDPVTGERFWTMSGMGGAFSATPTFDSDRIIFGQSGRTSRGPLIAVNAGAEGELTPESLEDPTVGWSQDTAAPGMCSPVIAEGMVYVLSRGILSCHNAETGERVYRERLKDASSVTASLWAAGDRVYALNEQGSTAVVKAGPEFEVLANNTIEGLYWSSPTAAGGDLLIRSADQLHCIRD